MISQKKQSGLYFRGAEAQIMACYMATRYPSTKISMITFGAPRIGNQTFASWANALANLRMFRYVYERDLVPRFPANTVAYYHTGHTVQIWKNSKLNDYFHGIGARIYWRHGGCKAAGRTRCTTYKGRPTNWSCKLFICSSFSVVL